MARLLPLVALNRVESLASRQLVGYVWWWLRGGLAARFLVTGKAKARLR